MRLAASLIVELHASIINIEQLNNSNYFVFVLEFPEENIHKISNFTNLFYQKNLKVEAQRYTKTYNYLFSKCKEIKSNIT
jgi:2-phosphoglycerate kinase